MVQSALFHDCLALSFWLNVPIIARMGSLFYVTISVDSVLLSFPKLVKIHNVIWLGISKFCSSWIYCWAEIYRKQIIHGWLWPRRAYHPLAIANILFRYFEFLDCLRVERSFMLSWGLWYLPASLDWSTLWWGVFTFQPAWIAISNGSLYGRMFFLVHLSVLLESGILCYFQDSRSFIYLKETSDKWMM